MEGSGEMATLQDESRSFAVDTPAGWGAMNRAPTHRALLQELLDRLFQGVQFREDAGGFLGVDLLAVDADLEGATVAGYECDAIGPLTEGL
jgi:hypothetical protein